MSEFTCEVCHEVFERDDDFSEEMAIAEYERLHQEPFPGFDKVGVVCEECGAKVLAWARERGLLP